jgi:hypothetical protein
MEQIGSRPYLCKVYGTTDSDGPTFENVHGPDCRGLTYACFFTHDACSPAVCFLFGANFHYLTTQKNKI